MGLIYRLFFMVCMAIGLFYAPIALGKVTLDSVVAEPVGDALRVTLTYSDVIQAPKVFSLGDGKPRIVIDVSDISISKSLSRDVQSPVAGVRHAARGQGSRVVLDLVTGAKRTSHDHIGAQTFIYIKGKMPLAAAAPAPVVSGPREAGPSGIPVPRLKPYGQAQLNAMTAPVKKRLIVIDAGHGGYDPGAIGATGSKEKTVTLKAAQELQNQLLKTGRYEVYLTRSKDVYVDHYERVRRARVREADLFISLHADALESRKTRGASVYTLAAHAKGRSTKLVDKQNFIVDVDLTQETDAVGDILVSLAQKKTFSNSHRFAEMLIPEIEKVAPILRNTHRQKGLAVLLAPDVPAVLFEMGYISNATDEKALNSVTERRKKMRAVVKTIDRYFSA